MRTRRLAMLTQRWFIVIALFWVVVVGGIADAQVLTGSISGTVRDDSGGVLPGATVRASSLSLIGGPVVVMTDERGARSEERRVGKECRSRWATNHYKNK